MKRKFINYAQKKNKGFTIVELLVVITIIGVLSSFVSVGYFGYVKKSKESVALAEAKEIYQALEIGLANDVFADCSTVNDLVGLDSSSLINSLETKCGVKVTEDAVIAISNNELSYSARGVTVKYKFG
jgi:prepilin-type N-terminal cleavage/methylation domain-containing protein